MPTLFCRSDFSIAAFPGPFPIWFTPFIPQSFPSITEKSVMGYPFKMRALIKQYKEAR